MTAITKKQKKHASLHIVRLSLSFKFSKMLQIKDKKPVGLLFIFWKMFDEAQIT